MFGVILYVLFSMSYNDDYRVSCTTRFHVMLCVEGPKPHDRKRKHSTPIRLGKLVNHTVEDPTEVVGGEGEGEAPAMEEDHTICIHPEDIVPHTQQRLVVMEGIDRTSSGGASL